MTAPACVLGGRPGGPESPTGGTDSGTRDGSSRTLSHPLHGGRRTASPSGCAARSADQTAAAGASAPSGRPGPRLLPDVTAAPARHPSSTEAGRSRTAGSSRRRLRLTAGARRLLRLRLRRFDDLPVARDLEAAVVRVARAASRSRIDRAVYHSVIVSGTKMSRPGSRRYSVTTTAVAHMSSGYRRFCFSRSYSIRCAGPCPAPDRSRSCRSPRTSSPRIGRGRASDVCAPRRLTSTVLKPAIVLRPLRLKTSLGWFSGSRKSRPIVGALTLRCISSGRGCSASSRRGWPAPARARIRGWAREEALEPAGSGRGPCCRRRRRRRGRSPTEAIVPGSQTNTTSERRLRTLCGTTRILPARTRPAGTPRRPRGCGSSLRSEARTRRRARGSSASGTSRPSLGLDRGAVRAGERRCASTARARAEQRERRRRQPAPAHAELEGRPSALPLMAEALPLCACGFSVSTTSQSLVTWNRRYLR